MTSRERFQLQLDKCGRMPAVKPSKPLTGIEKMQAEEQETTEMWRELNEKGHR